MFKWLLVGVFFLTACSKNENKSIPEQIIYYEAGVGITTTSGDFGQVGPTSSKVVTFSIKNTGDAPLQGPPSIDNANFSIIYQNGCASVAPNKSCLVKVAFDAKGKSPGVYESNLNLDSFFLELSAEIPAPVAPAPEVIQVQYQPSSTGSPISEIDFGTLQGNQSATKTFYIKNVSTVSLNQAVSFPSNYNVSYDMCSNRVVGVGKSCMIKVTLSAQGKSGNQDASLSYAGASFSLKGNVQATELPPTVTPVLDVDYLVSNQIVTTVDYGEISPTGSKLVSINLKNTGNVTLNEAVILTGEYDLIYDTCSSKAIGVNKTCQVRVALSGAGKSGTVAGNVAFAGQNLSLTGFVATPQTPSPTLFPEIVYLNGTAEVSTVDMGFFPYGSSQQLILNIKNKGTLADVAKTASLNNSNFSIGYNQCVNKALAVNESCQVRIIFAANGKPEGTYTSILSFGDVYLSLTAFAGNALITYEPIYSDYGSCSVTEICQGLGTKSRTITGCQKLANGAPIEGAVLSDCTSFSISNNLNQECSSPAGIRVFNANLPEGYLSRSYSCLEGKTEFDVSSSLIAATCNLTTHYQEGVECLPNVITYQANYSTNIGTCSAVNPCDGIGTQEKQKTSCDKYVNGVLSELGVSLDNCSQLESSILESCLSPAGSTPLSNITGGTISYSCQSGDTISSPSTIVNVTCSSGYIRNGNICELIPKTDFSAMIFTTDDKVVDSSNTILGGSAYRRYTVSVWFKISGSPSTNQSFFSSRRFGGLSLGINTSCLGTMWVNGGDPLGGGNVGLSGGVSLCDNQWHNITAVSTDYSTGTILFVDGIQRNIISFTGPLVAGASGFNIGPSEHITGFNGQISQIDIWSSFPAGDPSYTVDNSKILEWYNGGEPKSAVGFLPNHRLTLTFGDNPGDTSTSLINTVNNISMPFTIGSGVLTTK